MAMDYVVMDEAAISLRAISNLNKMVKLFITAILIFATSFPSPSYAAVESVPSIWYWQNTDFPTIKYYYSDAMSACNLGPLAEGYTVPGMWSGYWSSWAGCNVYANTTPVLHNTSWMGVFQLSVSQTCLTATPAYSFNPTTWKCERTITLSPTTLNPIKNVGDVAFCPDCLKEQTHAGTNPINSGTGNKFQYEVDYIGAGQYPLQMGRMYNSTGIPFLSSLGMNWQIAYDRSIVTNSNGTSLITATVKRADGKQYYFNQAIGTATPPLTTTTWTPDADVVGSLVQIFAPVVPPATVGAAAGWRYTNENDEVETYDVAGKLLSLTNKAGLVQTLSYSDGTAVAPNGGYVLSATGLATATVLPAGRLIRVTDPAGRSLQFGYDASGRVVKAIDPAGGAYLYAYNGLLLTDNLSSVTYPDGKVRTYLYGELANISATPAAGVSYAHALTGIVDENGTRYASWTYDANGRATSSEHGAFGSGIDRVGLSYGVVDANGNSTTTVTDPKGTIRGYTFSTLLGVVKNTGISGLPCKGCAASFTYDANGNVASRTDFKGNKTCYAYDLTRNLETVRIEGIAPLTACPANLATYIPSTAAGSVERKISTTWHPTLRQPTLIAEPGRNTWYGYDTVSGNLLSRTVTDTASNTSRTWGYSYTTAADLTLPNLLKSINGPRTDVLDITTYGYAANGDLKTISDALGHITTINTLDAAGRPLTLTDANGIVTTLGYTPRGWLASRKTGLRTTSYTYDGVGQITRVTLPDASHLDYTYDAAHRLTDITNAKLDHIHYTLDSMGNRIKEDAYDAAGKLAQTHSRVFDALNRLAQDISAYNATTSYTTHYSYDANGDLTQIVDAKNNATVIGYDALSRISRSTDAALGITDYSYDAVDQLTNVNDPKTFNTHYALNTLGEEKQLNSPDSGITNRSFDSAGNLAGATDARNIAATYAYDALNRPVSINYPASAKTISFTWDTAVGCTNGIGRLCQLTDSNGSTTYAYDDQGNLTQRTSTDANGSLTTRYVYDAANRLITVITPTGETLSMVRDAAGYIQQVDDTTAAGTSSITANVQYDGSGQATGELHGNGALQAMSYSLSGQSVTIPGTPASAAAAVGTDNDVPTLPEWGSLLLGSLLMWRLMRGQGQRRTGGAA